jgi:5-formyltetrahydrofolate cyclo-ligase
MQASTKSELRRDLREQAVTVDHAAVLANLRTLPELTGARCVLLYAPLPDEPDVSPLAGEVSMAVLPRIVSLDPPRLEAVQSRGGSRVGPFGIAEPVGEAIDFQQINVVLVPGLAFTRDGRRLGRGKGFYDRFLPELAETCVKVGVCADDRLLDELPTDPHDVPVDVVVTASRVYRRTDVHPSA